jgi:hypothetical protein
MARSSQDGKKVHEDIKSIRRRGKEREREKGQINKEINKIKRR